MLNNVTPMCCDAWSPFYLDLEDKDVETSLFWRFLPESGLADCLEVAKEACR